MSGVLRYGIISDTHGSIPARVFQIFDGVKTIYHCGDIGDMDCITELEALAPVRAVSGNMDHGLVVSKYPWKIVEPEDFGVVAMMHGMQFGNHNGSIIHGLLTHFAESQPRLILFGHSHVPHIEEHKSGSLIINPGSASHPRGGMKPTVVVLEYAISENRLSAGLMNLTAK